MGLPPHQVAVGLDRALWEAGPNPVSDFADALEFDGRYVMPPQEKAEWEALGRFREDLTRFLAGRNAAFIGGIAVRSYGGRAGPTTDFDLLIDEDLLKPMTAFLESQGAGLAGTVENTYAFLVKPCSTDFDVRVARTALDAVALSTAKPATFSGRALKIVLPAPLAAMKVKAYADRKGTESGQRDRADVRGLIACGSTSPDAVRDVLARHSPLLLPALEEILKD